MNESGRWIPRSPEEIDEAVSFTWRQLIPPRPAWYADAACLEHPEVDFFPRPGDRRSGTAAKRVCADCLVRAECLAYATAEMLEGIWGGTTDRERARLRGRRRAA